MRSGAKHDLLLRYWCARKVKGTVSENAFSFSFYKGSKGLKRAWLQFLERPEKLGGRGRWAAGKHSPPPPLPVSVGKWPLNFPTHSSTCWKDLWGFWLGGTRQVERGGRARRAVKWLPSRGVRQAEVQLENLFPSLDKSTTGWISTWPAALKGAGDCTPFEARVWPYWVDFLLRVCRHFYKPGWRGAPVTWSVSHLHAAVLPSRFVELIF